jgi:hypothetical protein
MILISLVLLVVCYYLFRPYAFKVHASSFKDFIIKRKEFR